MLSRQCNVTPRELSKPWEGLAASQLSASRVSRHSFYSIFVICSTMELCCLKKNKFTTASMCCIAVGIGIFSIFAFLQCSKYDKGRCLNGDISVLIQIVNGTSPPLVAAELPQMLSQPAAADRCHCPAEKVRSIPSKTGLWVIGMAIVTEPPLIYFM